jgi:hypothetical protein
MKRLLISAFSALSLAAIGCSSHSRQDQAGRRSPVKIDKGQLPIESSFAINNPKKINDAETSSILAGNLEQGEYNSIKLNKGSLGKLFLLTPSLLVASNVPIIDQSEPKLVTFQQNGNKLALYEVNFDVVYDDFDANKLLQVFDIVAEDAQSLKFQWNFGLEYVPLDAATAESDFPDNGKLEDAASAVLPATTSFTKDLSFANNSLFVEQVLRVRTEALSFNFSSVINAFFLSTPIPIQTNDLTVHLTMEIAPYTPNPDFSAKKSAMDDGIGFFTTLSLKKGSAEPGYNAMRWDIGPGKEPVTYAITSSVPAEMEAAVSEGILYWNKVLGFEGIRVETGADPKSLPLDKRVLVHWINWEDAGFARAQMQADPITGEIKRADIYMTSVFREVAKVTARRLQSEYTKKIGSIVPAGFSNRTGCTLKYSDFQSHQGLYVHNVEPENLERGARDMVRAVIAHEVGHTMGLRHNFAGSQDSQIKSHGELEKVSKAYFSNPKHGGAVTANTVMDYLPTIDDMLLGAKIKTDALPYDRLALNWGYNNGAVPDKSHAPSFCTDSGASSANVRGCEAFDSNSNALSSAAGTLSRQRTQLTRELLDELLTYRFAKNPDRRMSVEKLLSLMSQASLAKIAVGFAAPLRSSAKLLESETRLFSVDRLFDGVGPTWYNQIEYKNATTEKLRQDLATVGNLQGLIAAAYPMKTAADKATQPEHGWLRTQIMSYIDAPEFRAGRTLEGVEYELSASELSQIRSFAAKLADEFEGIYLAAVLQSVFPRVLIEADSKLSGIGGDLSKIFGEKDEKFAYRESLVQGDWATSISSLVRSVVLTTEKSISGNINGKAVTLPKSLYRTEARIAALSGLDAQTFATNSWLNSVKTEIKSTIAEHLKPICGSEFTMASECKNALKELELDKTTRDWADSEIKLLVALEKLDEN